MGSEFLEAGIDFERANAARMYDYYLGGAHNFAVDRERAEQVIAGHPHTRRLARANRSYLRRVVDYALAQGITQFLDLGSGAPTVGNVHEVAQRAHPDARVAYIDFEPVAVAHAQQIITETAARSVTVTQADIRLPETVLGAPGVTGLLDFDQPVALLAIAVLHFVDDDITQVLHHYTRRLRAGSIVAISHTSDDHDDPTVVEHIRAMREAYSSSATPLVLRSRADLADALAVYDLLPPGIVDVTDWPTGQPDTEPTSVYAAVARV